MTEIRQATWLCGSLPLGCIITYLEKFLLLLESISMLSLFRKRWFEPNRWWYTFDTLKRNEWSVMWEPGCKTYLLNPVYSPLEIHDRRVVPYLVKVGIQSPISARGFVCILYMWSVRCKRSARFCLFVFRHYYNTRQDIGFKNVLGYRKVKTVRVYVWIWSYDYHFLSKGF